MEQFIHAMVGMQETEALQQAEKLLGDGVDPRKILGACSAAMETVGERFEKGEYFLPHLIMAGEMLNQIAGLLKSVMKEDTRGTAKKGKVLIGTVKGDIHDIGKNIATFLLEANGFEVRDIGIDQHPDSFVQGIRDFQPDVVGMSGLLTLAFESMKNTVRAIEAAGLRDIVRIMIGGAQVSEQVKNYTGADAYAPDAVAGVRLTKQWIGGQ